LHQVLPRRPIRAEGRCRVAQIALQHDGCTVIKRVSQRRIAVNPFQAMPIKLEAPKKWRASRHGNDCGTEVVAKARQSQLHGADSSASLLIGFENIDVQTGLCQSYRGRQTIRPCSNYVRARVSWR